MSAPDLFDDVAMAAGYARDRPPVHPHLMARLRALPGTSGPAGLAVDVGCGAGASAVALRGLAERIVGLDPYPPMIAAAARSAGDVRFAVAAAEALPLAAGTVDLLAAAGSLNYADLGAFVGEAHRVLAPGGTIVVSNYSFGRPAGVEDAWPARFSERWRRPTASVVDATSFAGGPFRVVADERFPVTIPMTIDAYLAYLMTETSVAQAIRDGADAVGVRAWCAEALARGFGAEQPVVFEATLVVLSR